MTPIEATAKALYVSARTLRRWVAAGAPHQRIGAGPRAPIVFDLDALRGWCAENGYTGQPGRPTLEVTLMRDAARARAQQPPAIVTAPVTAPAPPAPPTKAEMRRLTAQVNALLRRPGARS